MKHKFGWTLGFLFLLVHIPNFTYTFDCYYCENCLNTQRGVRITARPEDWCYKIVWRSGRGNQQMVSRGASSDCRQDSYNDPSMAIPGFTCLRSLTLIDIGPDFWESIVTKLQGLKYLRSFLYISSTRIESWVSNISDDEVTELDKRLSDSYCPILSQLNRLALSHGDFLGSVQFPCLHHLTLGRCNIDIIKHILHAAPQLKSLNTNFRYNKSTTEFIFPFGKLNRLTLKIEGSSVSMKNMEQLLGNLPSLKYLELHANGHDDLVDGQRWQMITSRLIMFNFYFSIPKDLESQDLDSFRSSFWLNEKHWFVASINRSLFSVPSFAETCANEEFQPITVSTLSDNTIFYDCITQLTVSEPVVDINQRFLRVRTLAMFHFIPLSSIEQIVDLNRIQNLILCSSTNYSGMGCLLNEMPNLWRISIRNKITYFIEEVQCKSYDKIRKLDIGNRYSMSDNYEVNYSIEQLCIVFPKIEQLNICHWCPTTEVFCFINRFPQLLTVSFHFSNWILSEEQRNKSIIEVKSTLDQSRCSQKFNYTYRFDRSSVYIWL
ncbi:unnamed protein product [Rotaria sp. Silwood2]|nr:unnamed protein product [Rotaria sp. Silwood2]CAF3921643.1 unnamed protein product [Rotaria sp. Silwood2]